MKDMRVCEVMQRPITAVRHNDTAREAALMLAEFGYAALPVLDQDARLIGVLTSGDLLRAGELDDTVREAMTTPAVSVPDSATLAEVMSKLVTYGLRSLPVVDADGRVVGMFSRGDVLRIMLTPTPRSRPVHSACSIDTPVHGAGMSPSMKVTPPSAAGSPTNPNGVSPSP